MGLVCRILQLKKALGGANRFFLTGQSGARAFFQVKMVLHRPGGTIHFAWALSGYDYKGSSMMRNVANRNEVHSVYFIRNPLIRNSSRNLEKC